MKIAIDIDDTLTLHQTRDTKFTLEFAKANNIALNFVNGKAIEDGITIEWTPDLYEKFWNSSFGKNFYKYAVVSNKNKQIIKILQKRGHEVYFITARNPKWQELTKNWLKRNQLENVGLIFAKNKGLVCHENNIDIFVDNDLKTCKQVSGFDIKTYHFNSSEQHGDMKDLNDLLKITKTGEIYEKWDYKTIKGVLSKL